LKKLLLIALLLCPLQAFAEEEDWYTYWSFGFSNNNYPGGLDSLLDTVEAQPGVTRAQIAIDMLGFYWPIDDKLILGFVVSGSGDGFTTPLGDFQVNQYLYGASIMKFFGKETGDGLFLRGDLGFSKASITADSPYGGTVTSTSDTGVGMLFGVGYGVPVSEKSRILFSINVHNNDIEGDNWSAVSFNVGGLW